MSCASNDIQSKLDELRALNKELADLFIKDDNIHAHTRKLGQYCAKFYYADIANKFSSQDQKLETIIKEILDLCEKSQVANVTTVLRTIQNTTQNDPETGANVQELFIRTWSLARNPNASVNAIGIFIDSLDQNIVAQGGCAAGIAARLIQPYTSFVLERLENKQLHAKQDDDLAKALALSAKNTGRQSVLHQYDKSKNNFSADKNQNLEDVELELALALSMQSNKH